MRSSSTPHRHSKSPTYAKLSCAVHTSFIQGFPVQRQPTRNWRFQFFTTNPDIRREILAWQFEVQVSFSAAPWFRMDFSYTKWTLMLKDPTRAREEVEMNMSGATPRDQKMLLGRSWVDAANGETLPVENPFDRSVIAYVPRARSPDVDRAVAAAAAAFPVWRRVPPRERGRTLIKIADVMEKEIERLARLLATETGNAIRTQARPEIRGAIDIFRYFGGLGSELKGSTLPFGEDVLSYTRREPIGVVGGIIAWNAPVTLASVKVAPALCAGNTIVLKAAEDAPLTVLAIAEIAQSLLPP